MFFPEVFDSFVRSYINNFRNKSINTSQFKEYLLNFFDGDERLKNVDWDTWLHSSGMPPTIPQYDMKMTEAVNSLLKMILEGNASLSSVDIQNLTMHQQIHLLQELVERPALPLNRLRNLGDEYSFRRSNNTEILYRWYRLCIKARDKDVLNEVFDFVNHQGRMKIVRPIYRDLYAWKEVRDCAIENFLKNEPYMMHVSAYMIRKDLHLDK
ncbi:unnamed protein product [Diatraea saccharalis]|uniref:Peptidase M1 leukotriene A4 hydrolase/aminopeptidase C-terminal domain-containing protein n=1 Tax=Diatraea saccharalis TaxID=40085 RepID=A0A9N9WKS9_9NEOP|nr:unnamed protein product [Diatraea saccharalis]